MSKTYKQKLANLKWKIKREEILERDKYKCAHCKSTENLQVHHIKYTGEPWEAPDTDLITLCFKCHRAEHSGQVIAVKGGIDIEIAFISPENKKRYLENGWFIIYPSRKMVQVPENFECTLTADPDF